MTTPTNADPSSHDPSPNDTPPNDTPPNDTESNGTPPRVEPPNDRAGSTDIVVIGLMGSGKTTVGFALAQRLGRPFADSDSLLCLHRQRTAREIADDEGLEVLHEAEHDVARVAMSASTTIVFAAAASVMDLEPSELERLLADAWVVWLDAPADVLEHRVEDDEAEGGHRPVFDRDDLRERCELDERRLTTAERVSHLRVDVSTTDIEQIVEHVVSAWDRYRRPAA
jgi:shikimate kinase